MIELSAPEAHFPEEKLISSDHRCNYCSGNGWFWGVDAFGESVHKECPFCQGTGRLDAHITIIWKPKSHNNGK